MKHNYTVLLQSKQNQSGTEFHRPLRIGFSATSWQNFFQRLKKEYLIDGYHIKSAIRRPQ